MKLSVSAWSVEKDLFAKKTTLREFIDFCNKNHVDAVELLDCFFESDEHISETKKYLDSINMPVAAYSIGNDFVNALEERKAQVDKVKKSIDIAIVLGTNIVRVFSGNPKEGILYEQGKEWIIECFRECAEYAEKKKVVMVLENHGVFAGKSEQVKEIIDAVASPYLKANTDTGNFLLVGEKPYEAIKGLKDYVGFVHFKDFREVEMEGSYKAVDGTNYIGTVIGEGEVPLEDIVDFLYKIGYDGYLSIEFEGEGECFEGTLKSIAFSKTLIRS